MFSQFSIRVSRTSFALYAHMRENASVIVFFFFGGGGWGKIEIPERASD